MKELAAGKNWCGENEMMKKEAMRYRIVTGWHHLTKMDIRFDSMLETKMDEETYFYSL